MAPTTPATAAGTPTPRAILSEVLSPPPFPTLLADEPDDDGGDVEEGPMEVRGGSEFPEVVGVVNEVGAVPDRAVDGDVGVFVAAVDPQASYWNGGHWTP